MITADTIDDIAAAKVVGPNDDKIGKIDQIYVSEQDGQPVFASISSGLFNNNDFFIPLRDADFTDGEIHILHSKQKVENSPKVADDGNLNTDEQDQLLAYYYGEDISNLDTNTNKKGDPNDTTTGADYATDLTDNNSNNDSKSAVNKRAQATDDDTSITRSEERLNVGTEKVATSRARLKKYIVTEQQTITVPVSHEEVRLEREPITDPELQQSLAGADLNEEEHEIVLTAERPVVTKETVAVERVHLATTDVTENQTITADVRKEEIVYEDGDTDTDATR